MMRTWNSELPTILPEVAMLRGLRLRLRLWGADGFIDADDRT
jgi:hypothetical protein